VTAIKLVVPGIPPESELPDAPGKLSRPYRHVSSALQKVQVIDSHTGGEPTRVVVSGGPDLGGSVADKLRVFRTHSTTSVLLS